MNFSKAFASLLGGQQIYRQAWRPNIVIKLDNFDGRTIAAVDTRNAVYSSPSAVKGIAPWTPSQCDMFANDWLIATTINQSEHCFDLDLFKADMQRISNNIKEVH